MNQNTKFVIDSFVAGIRRDNAYYAADLVNATLQELFHFEYPEFGWLNGGLISIRPQVSAGAATWDFLQVGPSGEAEEVADNATDIPNIDVEGDRTVRGITNVGCQFEYTELDLDRSRDQSLMGLPFDLPFEKAEAARYAHDKKTNSILAFGVPSKNIFGILNQPGMPVQPATTGNWATATSEQIQTDVRNARDYMIASTGGVERPDTCVVSPAIMALLEGTPWNSANASNVSVLDYIQSSLKLTFKEEFTMSTASASGGEALLMYANKPNKVFGVMPLLLQTLPTQHTGYVHRVPMRSRCGGVGTPHPLSLLRLDGI